jgi:hypothetical protein
MKIIRDTRERVGFWTFQGYDECTGVISRKLDTGDYSIEGLEKEITIDRKKTVGELIRNLDEYDRFERECIRMIEYKQKYIVCEFSLDDLANYPNRNEYYFHKKNRIRINGKYALRLIAQLESKTGVSFIYSNNKSEAEQKALELLHNVYIENQRR